MAKKSKSQRAKATAAKANRKERQQREELAEVTKAEQAPAQEAKESKGGLLKKKEPKAEAKPQAAAAVKKDEKPKKVRFKFIKDVRAELKRVTWPTRSDVLRWSGVVVCALLFFGIFTAVLDNLIVTPALVALSGLGA